jgi:hypothetical protein
VTGCHCRDFVGHDPDNRSSTSPHTPTYVTIATLQRAQALLVSGPGQTGEVISFEQQERWVWARARRSLDPSVAGFGARGLLAYLDSPGIAVTVLPADVLGQLIEFTDDLPGLVLPDRFDGITGNGVSLLSDVTTTSTALVRFAPSYDHGGWRGFVALDRCGGVQAGIGATARYQLDEGRNVAPSASVLRLFVLVHIVRVVVHAQARVIGWVAGRPPAVTVDGPFEIVVAVPDTEGMMLGGLNEGWEQPEYAFDPPRALEDNVMVRVQVEDWPTDPGDLEILALRVVDRVCEAFGDRQQRYLRAGGPEAGTISRSYA